MLASARSPMPSGAGNRKPRSRRGKRVSKLVIKSICRKGFQNLKCALVRASPLQPGTSDAGRKPCNFKGLPGTPEGCVVFSRGNRMAGETNSMKAKWLTP